MCQLLSWKKSSAKKEAKKTEDPQVEEFDALVKTLSPELKRSAQDIIENSYDQPIAERLGLLQAEVATAKIKAKQDTPVEDKADSKTTNNIMNIFFIV